jgi:hypothetical protein
LDNLTGRENMSLPKKTLFYGIISICIV